MDLKRNGARDHATGRLGSLITDDGECTTKLRTRLNKGQAIAAENMEKSWHIDFNENSTNKSASVVCSNIRL